MAATAQQQLADTYINEASKLNGENYVNWKFKLQTVLELFGGWTIVNGTVEACRSCVNPKLEQKGSQSQGDSANVCARQDYPSHQKM